MLALHSQSFLDWQAATGQLIENHLKIFYTPWKSNLWGVKGSVWPMEM